MDAYQDAYPIAGIDDEKERENLISSIRPLTCGNPADQKVCCDIIEWPDCPHNTTLIGNGECNEDLLNVECNFDGLDCCEKPELAGNGQCDIDLRTKQKKCAYDNGDWAPTKTLP